MSRHRAIVVAAALVASIGLAACVAETPAPLPTAEATPVPTPTATIAGTPTAEPTAAATEEPTPEPELSLPLPEQRDQRQIAFAVDSDVADDGGVITVTVTNRAESRIDEIVLRWSTELGQTLFLAPFRPSQERIRDGGEPLVQPWTKWVEGPGERGEPAGATSLGYGPMDPGMTLSIPLYATRRAPGAVAFDLQFLAGEALLSTADSEPAATRVEVP